MKGERPEAGRTLPIPRFPTPFVDIYYSEFWYSGSFQFGDDFWAGGQTCWSFSWIRGICLMGNLKLRGL
jgi:hypothetical protein